VSTTDLVFQGLLGPHLHDGHTRELGVVAWQVRKKMTVGMGEGGDNARGTRCVLGCQHRAPAKQR
jgi:hypothetical protein